MEAPGSFEPLESEIKKESGGPARESIRGATIADTPTGKDSLGFAVYAHAVADFLQNPRTLPPLTMSVEGEWGSGKSSFLLMLERLLTGKTIDGTTPGPRGPRNEAGERWPLTVRFNAWRHDREESLWASFALEFLTQVRGQQRLLSRLAGDLRLFFLRFSWRDGWVDALRAMVAGVVLAVFPLAVVGLLATKGVSWTHGLLTNAFFDGDGEELALSQAITLWITNGLAMGSTLLAAIGVWRKLRDWVGSPLQAGLRKHLSAPDYEGRVEFIEAFHKDFGKIVEAYAGHRKVYVFVDDLDRCDVPRSADLMAALNLLIAADPRIVFLLAMDREKVAAGIALKHERILPYLAGSRGADVGEKIRVPREQAIAYGYSFLEKFVQVPFAVPTPGPESLEGWLRRLDGPREEDAPAVPAANVLASNTQGGGEATTDAARAVPEEREVLLELQRGEDSATVHHIALMVAPALDYNPRRLKQWLNAFRLRAFLAERTGLFHRVGHQTIAQTLTLGKLGKFVALTLRWPHLVNDLVAAPHLLQNLQLRALGQRGATTGDEVEDHWDGIAPLRALLAASLVLPSKEEMKASVDRLTLAELDLAPLLRVLPRVTAPHPTAGDGAPSSDQDTILPSPKQAPVQAAESASSAESQRAEAANNAES